MNQQKLQMNGTKKSKHDFVSNWTLCYIYTYIYTYIWYICLCVCVHVCARIVSLELPSQYIMTHQIEKPTLFYPHGHSSAGSKLVPRVFFGIDKSTFSFLHGHGSTGFGVAELVPRDKVRILVAAVWEFQPLKCRRWFLVRTRSWASSLQGC